MNNLNLDYENVLEFVSKSELDLSIQDTLKSFDTLMSRKGAGNDFLGWLDLPQDYDKEEFERILKASEKIKANSDVLLSIGIGGSYLVHFSG